MSEIKSYFNDVIRNAVETIIMVDINRKIKMIDGNLFGYKEEDIVGKPVDILFESREFYEPLFIKDIIKDSNTICIAKDGEKIPVSFSSVSMRDEKRKVIGVISIVRNIKEMEILEKRLVQSEKMVTIGQFSSGIAHQLNTPLSTILTYSQMILDDINKKAEMRKQTLLKRITAIEEQCQRSKEIVQHLLAFSRPHKTQFVSADINQIIKDALFIVEGELTKHKVRIIKELNPCPKIMGDVQQLKELIINMVINAQQAMPKGGTLTIITIFMPKLIKIRFQDSGEGIPEKDIVNIFEPFFTNKPSGTGLGLFMCRNTVYNHNGFIDVQSKLKEGTTFTISLPISKPILPETEHPS
ncbi:MAG: ATP-binding protein [bacterium]